MGNYHARCEVGENLEITSKDYLSLSKHFLVSLIIQQLYRELLTVADLNGGALDKRVMMYLDEIGTLPKIDGLEMIFSASRSRKIYIVAIIQSLAQFEKTYGREGAEIIVDNCQGVIFGSFAPNSRTAEEMSKNLGKQTILSGSVSLGSGDNSRSRSLQMIERPLMTVDELKSMPKGHFIVMKTGCHPMRTKLELFFKWGIKFEEPYAISEQSARVVSYADRIELEQAILNKYPHPAPAPRTKRKREAPDMPQDFPIDMMEEYPFDEPQIPIAPKVKTGRRAKNADE